MKLHRIGLSVGLALLLIAPQGLSAAPRVASAAGSQFAFDWSGTPASPQPWVPGAVNDWDLMVHNRNDQLAMEPVPAVHGSDCSPFPARHMVTTFAGSVFICKNHLMTALNGGGYSEIVMTPAQLLDFSGAGTVTVDASTLKDDDRDWIDFWITPFGENLLTPSAGVPPDLNGPPRDAILVEETSAIPSTWRTVVFHNYAQTEIAGTGLSTEDCVGGPSAVSATARATRAVTISGNHVTVKVGPGCVTLDANIPDPGFRLGVVELAHHSYSPDEGSTCNYTGCSHPVPNAPSGNTWHWSHFTMNPAIPFTMLRGDMPLTGLSAASSQTVHFAAPAPPNSYLRFGALARRGSVQVSANGQPFAPVAEAPQCGDFPSPGGACPGVSDGVYISYFSPIPAGTTSVTFRADNSPHANQPWTIQDVSIWSSALAPGLPPPSPSPLASPSPVGTPTPGASPSPVASPHPTADPSPGATPSPGRRPPPPPEEDNSTPTAEDASPTPLDDAEMVAAVLGGAAKASIPLAPASTTLAVLSTIAKTAKWLLGVAPKWLSMPGRHQGHRRH